MSDYHMTKEEALRAYTHHLNLYWHNHHAMRKANDELDATVKDATKQLRAKLRDLVKGTKWHVREAKWWHLIDHSKKPVTTSMQGTIEIERLESDLGTSILTFQFNDQSADFILSEIARITNPSLLDKAN